MIESLSIVYKYVKHFYILVDIIWRHSIFNYKSRQCQEEETYTIKKSFCIPRMISTIKYKIRLKISTNSSHTFLRSPEESVAILRNICSSK